MSGVSGLRILSTCPSLPHRRARCPVLSSCRVVPPPQDTDIPPQQHLLFTSGTCIPSSTCFHRGVGREAYRAACELLVRARARDSALGAFWGETLESPLHSPSTPMATAGAARLINSDCARPVTVGQRWCRCHAPPPAFGVHTQQMPSPPVPRLRSCSCATRWWHEYDDSGNLLLWRRHVACVATSPLLGS